MASFGETTDSSGQLDVAEVAGDVHVLPHRPAHHGDLASVRDRDLGSLLHAVDVRRERRDHDPPRTQRDQLAERLADEPLRAGHARPLRVRRVAEQEVDAAGAELRERTHVGLQTVDGRVVELPVPGVEDPPGGRLDHDRHRVGNRVRHAHELEPERAELEHRLSRLDLGQHRCARRARARRASTSRGRGSAASRSPRPPRSAAARRAGRRRGPRGRGSPRSPGAVDPRGRRRRAARGLPRGARRAGTRGPPRSTMRSSPYSRTVMFLPTSPRPPSGMIRSGVLTAGVYGRPDVGRPETVRRRPRAGPAARGSRGSRPSRPRRLRPAGAGGRRPRGRGAAVPS